MKMNSVAVIIHGSYGSPDENWFPWLKKELQKIGYKVFVPAFPTPKNQKLGVWKGIFDMSEIYHQFITDGRNPIT